MTERPLDRLNYYNGQRLEASDLKLEQEYHIRTRRWLNKSLYKPGIASGLDIRPETGLDGKNTRRVIIGPGLALDAEGREILLLEEEPVFVPGKPHKMGSGSDAEVEGLYLTIRYNEKSIEEEKNECIPTSKNGKNNGDRAAWGGPALIRAKPLFDWRDSLPYESSGEIVLGEVELDDNCKAVSQINTGVRRYVGAASDAKVRQYALEGERHIDKDNPGSIYFHIRGRQPNAVTLYLKAEKFSTIYYTELGYHSHGSDIQGGKPTGNASAIDQHSHGNGTLATDSKGHSHTISAFVSPLQDLPSLDLTAADWIAIGLTGGAALPAILAGKLVTALKGTSSYPPGPIFPGARQTPNLPPFMLRQITTIDDDQKPAPTLEELSSVGITVATDTHSHNITSGQTGKMPIAAVPAIPLHTHSYSAKISDFGASDLKARSGKALGYVSALKVAIDNVDVTDAIIDQLKDADPVWKNYSEDKLGNGKDNHPLIVDPITKKGGTGEIKLDFLPKLFFLEGEHWIELSVEGEGNGGRILYNLYVE